MESFLQTYDKQKIGEQLVFVPSIINMILLLVAYLIKGVMKHEAVGCTLLDLAMLLKRTDGRQTRELIAEAKARKLSRSLCFALRAVRLISPLSDVLEREIDKRAVSVMSDAELFRQLLLPGRARTWPRIKALVTTSDSAGDLAKAVAWEAGRKLAQKASDAGLF